jgi:hypothetical protein
MPQLQKTQDGERSSQLTRSCILKFLARNAMPANRPAANASRQIAPRTVTTTMASPRVAPRSCKRESPCSRAAFVSWRVHRAPHHGCLRHPSSDFTPRLMTPRLIYTATSLTVCLGAPSTHYLRPGRPPPVLDPIRLGWENSMTFSWRATLSSVA